MPLSLALPVLRVALWCVWAEHTVPKPPDHPESLASLPLPLPLCTSPHHHHHHIFCHPLCSPSAHHMCSGIAAGLPVSIDIVAGGSPFSASREHFFHLFFIWKNAVLQMLETWLSKERVLSNSRHRFLTNYEELKEQPSSVRQCSLS